MPSPLTCPCCCTPTPFGGGCTLSASGKKKKYMMMKHAVTEITSIHRMIAFSNFKCMKYPMISADLMIDRIRSTSIIRTGSKICLYPSTTSIPVRTSSAPHTQKYCPLLSSCAVVSCICFPLCFSVTPVVKGLGDLRRHQIHQREDEHPHQIHEVPVQP